MTSDFKCLKSGLSSSKIFPLATGTTLFIILFFGLFRNCLNCDSLRWPHTHFTFHHRIASGAHHLLLFKPVAVFLQTVPHLPTESNRIAYICRSGKVSADSFGKHSSSGSRWSCKSNWVCPTKIGFLGTGSLTQSPGRKNCHLLLLWWHKPCCNIYQNEDIWDKWNPWETCSSPNGHHEWGSCQNHRFLDWNVAVCCLSIEVLLQGQPADRLLLFVSTDPRTGFFRSGWFDPLSRFLSTDLGWPDFDLDCTSVGRLAQEEDRSPWVEVVEV